MRRVGYGIAALCMALALNACSDDTGTPVKPDGSAGPQDDGGGKKEGIVLPDGKPDTTVAPPKCDKALIGTACTKEGKECGDHKKTGMTCLLTSDTKGGVCVCQCIPNDLGTELVNEDTCPDLKVNVCGSVSFQNGSKENYCFRKCAPKLGGNDCNKPLVCALRSGASVGLFDSAVCAFHGCDKDEDCPVTTSKTCKTDGSVGCDTGDKCVPLEKGGADGLCAKPGKCDTASGLCAPRTANMLATAKVGDPCKDDTECAGNMTCEREKDMATVKKAGGEACTADTDCCSRSCKAGKCEPGTCTVHARNGYCVINGCAFAASLTEFKCPTGSICNTLYPSGVCLKSCELAKADSCRGNPADKLGDYECRAWNNIHFADGSQAASGPVCDFGDNFACDTFSSLDCSAFGEQNNPTHMVCRDIKTGKTLTDPKDPTGFCLDDTASGPAQ